PREFQGVTLRLSVVPSSGATELRSRSVPWSPRDRTRNGHPDVKVFVALIWIQPQLSGTRRGDNRQRTVSSNIGIVRQKKIDLSETWHYATVLGSPPGISRDNAPIVCCPFAGCH